MGLELGVLFGLAFVNFIGAGFCVVPGAHYTVGWYRWFEVALGWFFAFNGLVLLMCALAQWGCTWR